MVIESPAFTNSLSTWLTGSVGNGTTKSYVVEPWSVVYAILLTCCNDNVEGISTLADVEYVYTCVRSAETVLKVMLLTLFRFVPTSRTICPDAPTVMGVARAVSATSYTAEMVGAPVFPILSAGV